MSFPTLIASLRKVFMQLLYMEKEKFNQRKYVNQYKKEHYSPLKINLKKEEKEELDKPLADENIS